MQLELPELQQGFTELPMAGVWVYTPRVFEDNRGSFTEWLKVEEFSNQLGYPFMPMQGNISTSVPGTIRGIHFADVPPGQSKYVTCIAGKVVDVIVDIRTGSDTFGHWIAVDLDDYVRRGVYLPEGIGHAFAVPAQDDTATSATVSYLVSMPYDSEAEHGINPLDPTLGIDWIALGIPEDSMVLSEKDLTEKSLAQLGQEGALPEYDQCTAWISELKDGWVIAHSQE